MFGSLPLNQTAGSGFSVTALLGTHIIFAFFGVPRKVVNHFLLYPENDDGHPTDVIIVGNPGVGKSTLLTGMTGMQFPSGFSCGDGKTKTLKFLQLPAYPHIRAGDTPGLADVSLKEQAAEAITAALNDSAEKKRSAKIIFVVTTEAGRLRPADMYTIKTVMSSIKLPDGSTPGRNSYTVIINKCAFLEREDFKNGGQDKIENMLCSESKVTPIPTAHIKFLPSIPAIECMDDAGIDFADHFKPVLGMVLSGMCPCIKVGEAAKIDTTDAETKLEHMAAHLDVLEKKLEQQAKENIGLRIVEKCVDAAVDVAFKFLPGPMGFASHVTQFVPPAFGAPAPQPGLGAPQPGLGAPQPGPGERQPGPGECRPGPGAPQIGRGRHCPY